MGKKVFKPEEIDDFVHEHIQQKIDHGELPRVGFDIENEENFKREFDIYQTALFEGIVNGIYMCGGSVEGINTEDDEQGS